MSRILKCVSHILSPEKEHAYSRNMIAEHNYRSEFKIKLGDAYGKRPTTLSDTIYIYYICKKTGLLVCDRGVSRYGLGPSRAIELVAAHRARGLESFYTVGTTCFVEAVN